MSRAEKAKQAYGIDAVNEFDPLFEEIYDHCDVQGLDIDTLSHEAGAAQMEINFNHGRVLELADQAFLFKRTVRQTAINHGLHATFMAKPMQEQPGSAMHIHTSVRSRKTGKNIFANPDGTESDDFYHSLAGMQRYLSGAMALMAPYVNSYRRRTGTEDSPANLAWGMDNRTVGLRVPIGAAESRRIENRIPGADANPYLAIGATLAAVWLGLQEKRRPTRPRKVSGEDLETLPRNLDVALDALERAKALHPVLGEDFVKLFVEVKRAEAEAFLEGSARGNGISITECLAGATSKLHMTCNMLWGEDSDQARSIHGENMAAVEPIKSLTLRRPDDFIFIYATGLCCRRWADTPRIWPGDCHANLVPPVLIS